MKDKKYSSLENLPEPSIPFENNVGQLLAKLCLENLTNHSASNVHLGHNLTLNYFSHCVINIFVNKKDNE